MRSHVRGADETAGSSHDARTPTAAVYLLDETMTEVRSPARLEALTAHGRSLAPEHMLEILESVHRLATDQPYTYSNK
jgi:hypothetical protein